MNAHTRIFIAGHRGMVGSALVRELAAHGYRHLVTRTHAELDLTDQLNVNPLTINARHSMLQMAHADDASSQTYVNPCQSQTMDYNTTNIHFHGLNVPPVCHQDDVINTLIQPSLTPFRCGSRRW